MQIDPGGRWSLHGIVIGCVGAGAIMVFPTHLEIGWTLIVGGLLTSALVELNQRWPQPLGAMAGRVRHRLPFRREDPLIPLAQAVRELYEANRDQSLGRLVRGSTDGTEAGILDWLGYWVTARTVIVYGRRTASTVLEPMPSELHTVGGLAGGAARFERVGFETWTDLSVRRNAFRAMIPALSDASFPRGPDGAP